MCLHIWIKRKRAEGEKFDQVQEAEEKMDGDNQFGQHGQHAG